MTTRRGSDTSPWAADVRHRGRILAMAGILLALVPGCGDDGDEAPTAESATTSTASTASDPLEDRGEVELIADGYSFTEGPQWMPDGALLFTDSNIIYRLGPGDQITTFRAPSNMANGLAVDPEGRLLAAERQPVAVTRTEADGTITTMADRFEDVPVEAEERTGRPQMGLGQRDQPGSPDQLDAPSMYLWYEHFSNMGDDDTRAAAWNNLDFEWRRMLVQDERFAALFPGPLLTRGADWESLDDELRTVLLQDERIAALFPSNRTQLQPDAALLGPLDAESINQWYGYLQDLKAKGRLVSRKTVSPRNLG